METFFSQIERGWGYDLLLWFQSWRTDFVKYLFYPFDFMGTEIFYIVLFTVLYWCYDKKLAKRVSVILLINVWINAICKGWWKRPRPYTVSVVDKMQVRPALSPLTSYGLPSGHTMGSLSFFGYLTARVKPIGWKILFIVLVVLIPFSRLVHGMHYPQDIIGGFIISLVLLILYLVFEEKLASIFHKSSLYTVEAFSILFYLFTIIVLALINAEYETVKETIGLTSVIAGGLIGFKLESLLINFNDKTTRKNRFLRAIFGLLVTVVLYFGLKELFSFAGTNFYVVMSLRTLRYFIVGLWISCGAPLAFIWLKLAESGVKK